MQVMSVARPQQRAVGTEFDWLIVMVLRFVDDADALHDKMTPAQAIDSAGPTMRFLGFRDEQIHSQALGKELGDELPLNAVSRAVQRRGESSQSALPRRDGDDPTTDSALARQPNIVKPIAGHPNRPRNAVPLQSTSQIRSPPRAAAAARGCIDGAWQNHGTASRSRCATASHCLSHFR